MNLKDKIIALDIDGTITEDCTMPSEKTYKQISKLIKEGYNIVLITGRGYATIKEIYESCNMNTFCVIYNGAVVFNPSTKEVIRDVKFPKNYLFDLMENEEFKKLDCEVMIEQEDKVYSLTGYPWYKTQIVGKFNDNLKDDIYCVNIRVNDPNKHQIVEKIVNNSEHYRYRYWYYQGEVYCLNYTKKDGAETLLKHYNKTFEDLIFIGDSDNDLEILRAAKVGVAMKNATDNAKTCADQITKYSVHEDGAIRHLLEMIENN